MQREIHAWSTVGLSAVAAACGQWEIAAGCWLGILLHPDLDQGETPYGKVRKHRGLSHWPIIGTADRLLWFCWPLFLVVDLEPLLLVGAGLALSDLLHIGLDLLDKKLVRKGVNL